MRQMTTGQGTSVRNALRRIYKFTRARKAYITVLSCLVVFVATYLLILPALTLDQDEASKQGGIDVPTQAEQIEQGDPEDAGTVQEAEADQELEADQEEEITETPIDPDAKAEITASGETYEIAVEYGEDAMIPEGAELKVKEINDSKDAYAEIQKKIDNGLEKGKEDIPSNPALFDISIMYDGQEIEPAEGSEVRVEVKLASGSMKGMYSDEDSPILINEKPVSEKKSEMDKEIQVLHLTQDDEIDVMKTEDKISDKEIVSSFKTDSFSNWLVYLDEDLTDINITTGDSLTLRPYSEWVWKQNAELEQYQGGQWLFPSSDWDSWTNGGYTYYRHKQTGTVFRSFPKNDGQLNEDYTVVTSETITEGTFDLQTNKGKVIHVHVTPGDGNHKPNTVDGISGLKVNLFDYDVPNKPGQGSNTYDFTKSGSLDVQSNVATNPDNNNNINTGHDLKFLGYGGSSYEQNSDGYDWFWINGYTQQYAQQGIVKDELAEDGYPELTPGLNGKGERGNPSLKYLFDPESKNHNVYAFPDADGLFQQDNQGFYYYNSNSNYAEYNQSTNQFILYEHTYSQNTGGSNGANAKPIGFFPFHEYDTVDTQPEMNFNSNLNHHFGMSMAVDFEIPKSRKATDQQGNKHDIIYEFSGDDDLWVFVDDELVLDIGGIHQPVTGKINFTTGEITVYGEETITKTFSVGGHTMKMFYMERGGCDSNLSVKFNLPLVRAMGDIRVAKKSMVGDKTEPDRFLAGAVFGIWENPDCSGEPYTTATSDSNGYVKFENVPVKQAGQKYYLKEIVPPDGYLLNTTIFTATAGEPDENNKCEFTITEGTSEVETMTQEPNYPIVRDSRPDPIDLSVHKQWENADGSELQDPDKTAVFKLKRKYSYVEQTAGPANSTIKVYRVDSGWNNPRLMETREYAGNSTAYVNWTYNQYLWDGYKNWQYRVNNGSTQTKENGPASIGLTAGNTTNVYIYDGNLGTQYEQYGVENITVTGTDPSPNAGETTTGQGEDTEYQGPEITLPTAGGEWEDTFQNLVVQEQKGNRVYNYEYYIVEKTVPDGFEAVYVDGDGHPIANASSLATNETGSQTIVNRKLLDVPIEKHWVDFLGDEYTWTATFQLEQMEVKVNEDDPDASDAIKNFAEIDGKTLTISKGQHPVPTFDGLPMYRVHSNGTLYRIIYSVSETAYTVKDENNTIVAQWSKSEGVTVGGSQYTPHFEQDAGEHGNSIEDYTIILVNAVQNLNFQKGIDLGIQKEWQGDSDIANDDDAFATFVLKRHVHEEYRDYSNLPDNTEWVDITLDTWGAGYHDKQQTIHVPKNTELHIIGSIKGNTNANKIAFSQSSGQDPIELIQDNSESADKALFDITFTADQTKTIALTQGDNYVIGGRDGFFLSDTYGNKTSDRVDQSFSYEFTLNKANNWAEHFDYLPQIVEQDVDSTETAQTVYVYSYYIEEVDANPKGYAASFKDTQGNVLGDINNAIDVNSEITATNKMNTGALKFTKLVEVDGEHPTDAQYDLVDGNYLFTVTSAEGVTPAVTEYVRITVDNGAAVSYKIADSLEGLDSDQSKDGAWAVVPYLPEGDYIITEADSRNGLMLTNIARGDESASAVDLDNSRVVVHVTIADVNASNGKAQATFTNSYFNNDGPDRITLDIKKVFEGLNAAADIPDDFQVIVTYTTENHPEPIELTLKKQQNETVDAGGEHISIVQTPDGYTLNWHITNLPHDAENFKIKETNYDPIPEYSFVSATLDGTDITETAGDWHDMSVTAPTAELTNVTGDRRTSDAGHNLEFKLQEGDILLSKLTGHMGTMVISDRSLNTLEREAIKNGQGWPSQGGFDRNHIVFFSFEEHPEGFKYGGKTVTLQKQGDMLQVSFSHSASAQEYAYTVTYSQQTTWNNATLKNKYKQYLATLEIVKVDAADMTTPLENAQFTLKELDPNGIGDYLTGEDAIERESDNTNSDGKTSFTGIPDGYYEVKETKLPTGYVLVDEGTFYIKIVHGEIKRIVKTQDDPATEDVNEGLIKNWPEETNNTGNIRLVGTQAATSTTEAKATYKVGNTFGAELPNSGGPGTTWIYLLGSLLLIGCGVLLVARRRMEH